MTDQPDWAAPGSRPDPQQSWQPQPPGWGVPPAPGGAPAQPGWGGAPGWGPPAAPGGQPFPGAQPGRGGQGGWGEQPPGYAGGAPPYPPPAYGTGAPPQQPAHGTPPYPPPGYPPPGYGAPGYGAPGYGAPGYGPPGYGPGPAAPRPGIVPLRPLGVGEILDGAVSYIRRNPGATLGLSAIVAVVTQGLSVALQLLLFRGATLTGDDAAAVLGLVAGGSVLGLLTGVISLLATSVLTGMLVTVLGEAVLGRSVTWGAAWNRAGGRVPGLIGLSLLAGLVIGAILLVSVLPGILVGIAGGSGGVVAALVVVGVLVGGAAAIWIGVSWTLAAPAYVLESLGVVDALRRSWRLVRKQWWRVFGVTLLGGLIAVIVQLILAVPFGFGGALLAPDDPQALLPLVITAVGGVLASTVTTPFSAGVTGLLYVDQRIRREAFDLELGRAVGR